MAAPIEAKHDAPWLRRRKDSNGAEEIRKDHKGIIFRAPPGL
jgi:hypothetical protein